MTFNPRFTIQDANGEQEFFIPSHSSYLWNNAFALNEMFENTRIFAALVDFSPDAQKNAAYHFSSSVGYDEKALSTLSEPLRGALQRKIDRANAEFPATFIPFSELEASAHPGKRLLSFQWVLFNQERFSQDAPSMVVAVRDGVYDLPGTVLGGLNDINVLHVEYSLFARGLDTHDGHVLYTLHFPEDDARAVRDYAAQRTNSVKAALNIQHIDDSGLTQLERLDGEKLGIPVTRTTLIDNEQQKFAMDLYVHDDGVRINFAGFARFEHHQQAVHVAFPDPRIKSVNYYHGGPKAREALPKDALRTKMFADILAHLDEHQSWPMRNAPNSWRTRLGKVISRRLGYD